MGTKLVVFLLAWTWLTCSSFAFPLYYSANGSVLLTSTRGGNITLRPDGGGAVVATSVIAAQGGVALNNTLLTEVLVSTLLEQVQLISTLQAQVAKLQPPTCTFPGGDKLQYNGSSWECICIVGWSGANCSISPNPPPSSPPPPLSLGTPTVVPTDVLSCAYASSQQLPYYPCGNAVDGQLSTFWAADGGNLTMTVTFSRLVTLVQVDVVVRPPWSMGPDSAKSVTLFGNGFSQTSSFTCGSLIQLAGNVYCNSGGCPQTTIAFDAPMSTSSVTFALGGSCVAGESNIYTGISDITFWESSLSPPPSPAPILLASPPSPPADVSPLSSRPNITINGTVFMAFSYLGCYNCWPGCTYSLAVGQGSQVASWGGIRYGIEQGGNPTICASLCGEDPGCGGFDITNYGRNATTGFIYQGDCWFKPSLVAVTSAETSSPNFTSPVSCIEGPDQSPPGNIDFYARLLLSSPGPHLPPSPPPPPSLPPPSPQQSVVCGVGTGNSNALANNNGVLPGPTGDGGNGCDAVNEGGCVVTARCPAGAYVSAIDFASVGAPSGSCGAYAYTTCNYSPPGVGTMAAVLATQCVGQATCALSFNASTMGDPCPSVFKYVALQLTCTAQATPAAQSPPPAPIALAPYVVCGTGPGNTPPLSNNGGVLPGPTGDGANGCDYAFSNCYVTAACSAGGSLITGVDFASVGAPSGTCGAYAYTSCNYSPDGGTVMDTLAAQCVGQASCTLTYSGKTMGDPCPGVFKYVALQVTCGPSQATPPGGGALANYALQGNASSSSVYNADAQPSNAIDNLLYTDGSQTGGTCYKLASPWNGLFETAAGSGGWWMVDLGATYTVALVTIYGRLNVPAQSSGLEVNAGASGANGGRANAQCASGVNAPPGGINVTCSASARYVSIFQPSTTDNLGLCQVQIWVALSPPPPTASPLVCDLAVLPSPTTSGLVAWWPLNESAGSVCNDVVGGYSITLGGSPTRFLFDGSTQPVLFVDSSSQVGFTAAPAGINAHTMTGWVSVTGINWIGLNSAGLSEWFGWGSSCAGNNFFIYNGTVAAGPTCVTSLNFLNKVTPYFPLNTWTFFAVTFDGASGWTTYTNDTLQFSFTAGFINPNNGGIFSIGMGNGQVAPFGGPGYGGYIGETRFYSRALSSSEVFGVYSYGAAIYGIKGCPPPPTAPPPAPPSMALNLTTCGAVGPFGPSLASCTAAYSGAAWAAAPGVVYSFGKPASASGADAWQVLTLPAGTYAITAAGASNGVLAPAGSLNGGAPCRGAVVTTTLTLPSNTSLFVIVGQAGTCDGAARACSSGSGKAGGGGGTFVLLANGSALVVAGGGGGWYMPPSGSWAQCDAQLSSSSGGAGHGANGDSVGGVAGLAGSAAAGTSSYAYGGAGLLADATSPGDLDNAPPKSVLNGGTGSYYAPDWTQGDRNGGFGGGGFSGGGGGYSGGGGSVSVSSWISGGGGSYCLQGLANCVANSYNLGDGYVTAAFVA